jgi:hypothetical protein
VLAVTPAPENLASQGWSMWVYGNIDTFTNSLWEMHYNKSPDDLVGSLSVLRAYIQLGEYGVAQQVGFRDGSVCNGWLTSAELIMVLYS